MPTPTFRGASQAASSSTSFACSAPTGVVAGDILIAVMANDGGPFFDRDISGGAAWNTLQSRDRESVTGSGGTTLWWKVAGSSEPSSYSCAQSSGNSASVSIVAVQGGATSTPVFSLTGTSSTTTSCTTPTTTPTGIDDFEIRCVALHVPGAARSFTSPAALTERTDGQATTGSWPATSMATRGLVGGGSTGVQTFTASTSVNTWHGITVNIAAGIAVPIPAFIGWGMPI